MIRKKIMKIAEQSIEEHKEFLKKLAADSRNLRISTARENPKDFHCEHKYLKK